MHTLENYLVVLCTDFDMDTTPLALSCNWRWKLVEVHRKTLLSWTWIYRSGACPLLTRESFRPPFSLRPKYAKLMITWTWREDPREAHSRDFDSENHWRILNQKAEWYTERLRRFWCHLPGRWLYTSNSKDRRRSAWVELWTQLLTKSRELPA